MKVCIVTVYNSTNCGSFLQAYALKETLRKYGIQVSFLETKVKKNRIILFKKILHHIKNRQFKKIIFDYTIYKNFQQCILNFSLTKKNSIQTAKQDVFILGSDEIWNVSRNIFRNSPIFWGKQLPNKIISYGPSINTASLNDIASTNYATEALSNMYAISVRDEHTKKIISQLTDKQVSIVCDPTFLLEKDEYDKIKGTCEYDNFILVYSAGGNFSQEDIDNFKNFSRKTKKILISFPHLLSWCDKSSPAHPLDAIAYFEKADYIITDTFHGTALSIIFQKRFASIPRKNVKVRELLIQFGLDDNICDNTSNIYDFFSTDKYSKKEVAKKIYQIREYSEKWLKTFLLSQN